MFQQRLAEEMKRRRKEMGITQEQLAEMIEKATAFVGQLERGVTRPKIDTLELIITKLSLDARYLFGADLSIEEDYQKIHGLMLQMSESNRKTLLKIAAVLLDSDM